MLRNVVARCALLGCLFSSFGSGPACAQAAPLRHLEFSFTAAYQLGGDFHSSGFGNNGSVSGGSGLSTGFGQRGRTGKIDVDVLGMSDDGALAFRIDEWLEHQVRPSQIMTCEAQDSGRVVCQDPMIPTDVEALILVALGRNFVDDSLVDAQGKWQRSYATDKWKVTTSYAMTPLGGADPVTITGTRESKSLTGAGADWLENETIAYNRSLKVPNSITDDVHVEGGMSGEKNATIKIALTQDSFAKQPAPAAH